MRRYIILVEIALFIVMLPLIVFSQGVPGVYVNGKLAAGHPEPVTLNGQLYIPVSVLTGVMKLDGELVAEESSVSFLLKASQSRIPVREIGGIQYAPASLVADVLGMKLTRDKLTGSVYLFDRIAIDETVSGPVPAKDTVKQIDGVFGNDEFFNWSNPQSPVKIAVIDEIASIGDRVEITADGKITPNIFRLTTPSRIVIDFPNARLSDALNGASTEPLGQIEPVHPLISAIRYAFFQNEAPRVRLVIDLKQPAEMEWNQPEPGRMVISIPYVDTKRVIIDAGHGGQDPGSPGASNHDEKVYTLAMAQKVFDLLRSEEGFEPVMMRSDDIYSHPRDRAAKANDLDADLFVSIHANSYESSAIRGTETYYYHSESIPFARIMHEHVLKATGFPDRLLKKMNYIVIKETKMVSALLEIGYLSNPQEEAEMWKEESQDRVAHAIVDGIKTYYQSQLQ